MRIACVLGVAALCALTPAAASAGELYIEHPWSFLNDDVVHYAAAAGETNLVSASSAAGGHIVNVYDEGAAITTPAGPDEYPYQGWTKYPCQLIDAHHGRCYVPDPRSIVGPPDCLPDCTEGKLAGVFALSISLGDGNDAYTAISTSDPFSSWVYGGPGDDYLIAGRGPWSNVEGGDGRNIIRVAHNTAPAQYTWSNWVSGGNGPDEIHAANGSYNDISCGGDVDSVVADVMDLVEPSCENVERR
jgi:hypothetical protein